MRVCSRSMMIARFCPKATVIREREREGERGREGERESARKDEVERRRLGKQRGRQRMDGA